MQTLLNGIKEKNGGGNAVFIAGGVDKAVVGAGRGGVSNSGGGGDGVGVGVGDGVGHGGGGVGGGDKVVKLKLAVFDPAEIPNDAKVPFIFLIQQ
jgi:hypothetical protein